MCFFMLNKMSLRKKSVNRKNTKESRSFIILKYKFKRKYLNAVAYVIYFIMSKIKIDIFKIRLE